MKTPARHLTGVAVLLASSLACSGPTGTAALAKAPSQLTQAPSRFAEFGGQRVHYKDIGAGPNALVFIHGWAGDQSFWRFQVEAFAGRSRLVAIDLPGHGLSDKPRLDYTLELFARSVNAVLEHAGVDRATLIGHSLGTPVGRQFYRLFRSKTRGLVAVDGMLKLPPASPELFRKVADSYKAPDYLASASRAIDVMLGQYARAELREEVKTKMLATPQHVMASAYEQMFDPAQWKESPIDVPLLVVVARSPVWSAEYEAFVHRIAPDVDYAVMEDAGHFLMMERPDEFNVLMTRFLLRHRLIAR